MLLVLLLGVDGSVGGGTRARMDKRTGGRVGARWGMGDGREQVEGVYFERLTVKQRNPID